ncbi:hypothetical protein K402DRAFT_341103 [Aulographum hederae CBS 113979]|uniref:RSC complex subunit Rsc9 n=1 Tax=Aulographum hederae CBS 113979 TaxID=1176131 RepID=A0A6G1GMW2_9PEZI|nr:hypothetical protein K402DRAFT_341103 [Aulographum hederae CBS 113979]
MAPLKQRDPSIEHTTEYEEFIEKLAAWHEERGTIFEREPKVGPRHIDLLKLYKRVTEEGGYDAVSDTKGNKLAWRRLAAEFLPSNANITQLAFMVKSAYYKNVASYEIKHFHGKEPPPKEILEDVTAKGGDLLNRTLENYVRPSNREADNLMNGNDSDDSEDGKTPRDDHMDIDDPGSTSGRVTRALRNAPPQRVLFNSEMSVGRQTRHSANHGKSSTPDEFSGHHQANGTYAAKLLKYEPQPIIPSKVQPVQTPQNAPDSFKNMASRVAALKAARGLKAGIASRPMAPGTGFTGPNIYMRLLMSLKSPLHEEKEYALHHLVKVSHERGDKYKFAEFPSLAEALMEVVLAVGRFYYDMAGWQVCYAVGRDVSEEVDVLDGRTGTSNLLEKIRALAEKRESDELLPTEDSKTLNQICEAALTLRNMLMLEENARYLAKLPLVKDVVVICLNLPLRPSAMEIRYYGLEMAEQLTRYYVLETRDPLYVSLIGFIKSRDRGSITTALRALSNIANEYDFAINKMEGISNDTLAKVVQMASLLSDESLKLAIMDWLFVYTAYYPNVETLAESDLSLVDLVKFLVDSLVYNPRLEEKVYQAKSSPKVVPVPEDPPLVPPDLLEEICATGDEREQSSAWMKTCFVEDPFGEITQIKLWQAYQQAFNSDHVPPGVQQRHMNAKDFITNVSNTFPGATAQVLAGPPPKYTIKGISPRETLVDLKGRPYLRCLWSVQDGYKVRACGQHFQKQLPLWQHVARDHLGLRQISETSFTRDENSQARNTCFWSSCNKRIGTGPGELLNHIETHLPDSSPKWQTHISHNLSDSSSTNGTGAATFTLTKKLVWWNTPLDDSPAAGISTAAILVLFNLARQLPRVDRATRQSLGLTPAGQDVDMKFVGKNESLMHKCFAGVRDEIFWVAAHNRSLHVQVAELVALVPTGGGW